MSGLEGLGVVANVIAVVDLSLKVISWCSKYAQEVKNSNDGRARLLQSTITLHYESGKIHDLLNGKNGSKLKASRKLAHVMGSSAVQLHELESLLSEKDNCSSLKWPLRKERVESAIRNIENATKSLLEVLQIDTTGIILEIDDRTEASQRKAAIDQLPYVSDAVWDSHAEEHNATCLENTRKDILRDINDWVENTTDQAKTVFWLNGMAGTGKSTISRTIARSLSENGRLGASFFFKRGETNRGSISKFVPTIARQLATNLSVLKPYIHEAVLQEPTITNKSIRIQFEKLVVAPLIRCSKDLHKETLIAIVVDALDECESDADIYHIINLFSSTRDLRHPRLRIFVTSRPDLPIRLGFKDVEGTYQDLILHEIPSQVIENDIEVFLQHETKLIKTYWDASVPERRKLPHNWPTNDCIRLLTKRAAPLFIFAATVCRFIADRRHGNPEEQLQRFLENLDDETSSRMGFTYKPVLSQLLGSNCSKRKKMLIINEFKRIVGTIINLASPLSPSALSRLLKIDQKVIDTRLDLLHSVLSVPSSSEEPIRMFHLSFRDYLINSGAEVNEFWIDEKQSAIELVEDCFRVMERLKPDVCHLGIPGTPRSTLKPEFINACIPPEVQYACTYWIDHQLVAGLRYGKGEVILAFLEKHLLHWVEVLTLLGRVYQITGLMRNLRSVLNAESKSDKELIDFLDDAIRFVDTDMETINMWPLQIYSSVLVFAPTNSVVRKTFTAELPGYVDRVVGTRPDWDPRLRSFYDHNEGIKEMDVERSIMFSPDSKLLCSSTKERIRVWSCDTGDCIEELKANREPLMAISPNGKYLAVTTGDAERRLRILFLEMIRITSELTQDTTLGALAFSQDSVFLWACSIDGEVKVWNVETETCVRELKYRQTWAGMFTRPVSLYTDWTFSLKYPKVLLKSDRNHAHVWFLESGEEGKSFDTTFCDKCRDLIRFSPDGKLLATPGARFSAISIWNLQSVEKMWELDRNDGSVPGLLVFSQNSELLAIEYDHQSILVWDLRRGACSAKVSTSNFSPFSAITFSPDMEFILFAQSDCAGSTIEGWSLRTKALTAASRCHIQGIHHLSFSPDGKLCISGGFDKRIQLWDWSSFLKESLEDPLEMHTLVLSHDASMAASVFGGQELRAWDTETGDMLYELNSGNQGSLIHSFAVAPNSQRIAVSHRYEDASPFIEVWKRASGTFHLEHTWDEAWGDHISFSPSGNLLFGRISFGMGIFCCDRGELFHQVELIGVEMGQFSMAIAEESSTLALGYLARVGVWDLKSMTGDMWDTEFDHDLVLSPTGTVLAGRSRRQTPFMRLWNWATRETVAEIEVLGVNWKFRGFLPDNSGVRTNYGDILLKPGTASRQYLKPTFTLREGWIQWKGYNLVKLPTEYEEAMTAITATASDLTVVAGNNPQRVITLKLSEDEELRRLLPLIGETA